MLQSTEGKLIMLDAATVVEDLWAPQPHRLEVLQCDRKGQHPIRVNDQWRFCLVWNVSGPSDVEVTDYR